MAQFFTSLLAAALMVGGALLRPPCQTLPTTGRHLVRPLVLPFLWRSLQEARHQGGIDEYVAKGRMVMQFVPEWSTGHVHLASRLAYEGLRDAQDPALALDRLWAGIQLLEGAMQQHPQGSEAYLRAAVAILYVQCNRHPKLAEAFTRRLGNPFKLAESYLRRIPRFAESAFLQDEIPFLVIDGMPHEILLSGANWRQVALRNTSTAMELLAKVRNQDLTAPWHRSMANLDSYLRGSNDISLRDLAADPRLAKIVLALSARVR